MRRPTGGGSDPITHTLPLLPAIALFLAGWAVIGWPWLSGAVVIPWDGAAHFYPQLAFLARALHAGDSPFWAPEVFAGSPQIADPQSLMFSPPFLLIAALDPAPSLVALSWGALGALAAGGLGVILWGRDRGWPLAAAVVAALVFAYGGSASWRLQHINQVLSLAHLPLALWALSRALDRGSMAWGALAGLVLGAMLVMRDHVALLNAYVLAGFVVWHWATRRRAALVPLAACGLVAVAVAIVPVVLTALWAAESNRPAIDLVGAGRGSLHPALLLTAVAADLYASAGEMARFWGPPSFHWPGTDLYTAQNMGVVYLGALPLVLLALALVGGRRWRRAPPTSPLEGEVGGRAAGRGVSSTRPAAEHPLPQPSPSRGEGVALHPSSKGGGDLPFLLIAAAVVLVYALGWYTPAFRLLHLLPGVDLFRRPADATFVLGGVLALVTGHLLARALAEPVPARRWVAGGALVLAVYLLALGVAAWRGHLADALPALVSGAVFLAGAALALAAARRLAHRPLAAALLLGAVVTADLAWNNGPNGASGLPRAMYAALEPDGREPTIAALKRLVSSERGDRVELAGLGFHWPNAGLVHGLDTTLGYNPLRSGLYSRATGAGDTVGLPDQRTFSPLLPSYHTPLANLLGLRFIVTPGPISVVDKRPASDAFPVVAETPSGLVHENRNALPRVRFATGWQGADVARLLAEGGWPDVDIRTTTLLDGCHGHTALPDPPPQGGKESTAASGCARLSRAPRGTGTARLVSHRNTDVVVETDADTDGVLVLHDAWHPWWTVTVDGHPAELVRADVIFRGVRVPAGRHTVRFVFRPFAGAWRQLVGP